MPVQARYLYSRQTSQVCLSGSTVLGLVLDHGLQGPVFDAPPTPPPLKRTRNAHRHSSPMTKLSLCEGQRSSAWSPRLILNRLTPRKSNDRKIGFENTSEKFAQSKSRTRKTRCFEHNRHLRAFSPFCFRLSRKSLRL